ncbi:MAG: exodeoxyribonuclease III [Gammaproteobacteria bacterium]|nr:exodeoxyribonuclease III [Gammaproteobacteria bacterium]MCW8973955.1 exodeoxyribonuclease III [Gammaproteobacteria bacterium]MCW8993803.1 exodeoxyribonuclease III [Gammaproteobacteria bacterium]
MKIASWNVNSLNVRLPQVLQWLASVQPDVLALQETKLSDEKFPVSEIEAAGYHVAYSGQKTYNGVALLAKKPISDVITDVPGLVDPQRRILGATIDGVRVLNLYVVNGQEVGSEKFNYKLDWLQRVRDFVAQDMQQHGAYLILGDFNIAPQDDDVYNPEAWRERILCSTPEREALQQILDLGFRDTFRLFEQEPGLFSWWDYRMNAFPRNRGLRIDLILASETMAARCRSSVIDQQPRGWERPSDHTPVVAEFV